MSHRHYSVWNRMPWQCECGSVLQWQDQGSIHRHINTRRHKNRMQKCHHCHGRAEKYMDGKYYCNMHTTGVCMYLGCLGKDDVHIRVVSQFRQSTPPSCETS